MKAFFITGTDTGVGKTVVGRGLMAAAARRGLKVGCMKPVESGCRRQENGNLVAEDAAALRQASNMEQEDEEVCLYRLEAAVAPGVAAAAEGITIDLDTIARAFEQLVRSEPDLIFVEGAGGLLVPFGEAWTAADLAQRLGLPLLVVARPGLGTINHTLLTLEAARVRGLAVAGFVFSVPCRDADMALMESNVTEICRVQPVPYLGCLRFVAVSDITELEDAANPLLDALLGA